MISLSRHLTAFLKAEKVLELRYVLVRTYVSDVNIIIILHTTAHERIQSSITSMGGILSVFERSCNGGGLKDKIKEAGGITDELQEAFHTFMMMMMMMMEKQWLEEPVGHLNSPLCQAYYAFRNALNRGEP